MAVAKDGPDEMRRVGMTLKSPNLEGKCAISGACDGRSLFVVNSVDAANREAPLLIGSLLREKTMLSALSIITMFCLRRKYKQLRPPGLFTGCNCNTSTNFNIPMGE